VKSGIAAAKTPAHTKLKPTLYTHRVPTQFGTVTLGATSAGLAHLQIGKDLPPEAAKHFYPIVEDAVSLAPYVLALEKYLASGDIPQALGTDVLPLDMRGTPFQKACWNALLRIPRGSVRSYQSIANELGSCARAVGQANGANPVAILVPCHRVIGSDGSLAGYGGGMEMKRRLLEFEGVHFAEQRGLF